MAGSALSAWLASIAVAAEGSEDVVGQAAMARHLLAAVVFSIVGVVILAISIWVLDRLTPLSFRKEILEDQNTALSIIVAAAMLGIAIIIAAAILG
jgi:uncharacterized membrane protein YjfL (UPF0719 family)